MSDLEVLKTALDAMGRGDVDALIAIVHPDFVGEVPPSMSAEPDSYTGPEGIRRYMAAFDETVEELRWVPITIEQVGDWMVVDLELTGRGRSSGAPFEFRAAGTVEMRDGKIVRMVGYPTLEEARAAVSG